MILLRLVAVECASLASHAVDDSVDRLGRCSGAWPRPALASLLFNCFMVFAAVQMASPLSLVCEGLLMTTSRLSTASTRTMALVSHCGSRTNNTITQLREETHVVLAALGRVSTKINTILMTGQQDALRLLKFCDDAAAIACLMDAMHAMCNYARMTIRQLLATLSVDALFAWIDIDGAALAFQLPLAMLSPSAIDGLSTVWHVTIDSSASEVCDHVCLRMLMTLLCYFMPVCGTGRSQARV